MKNGKASQEKALCLVMASRVEQKLMSLQSLTCCLILGEVSLEESYCFSRAVVRNISLKYIIPLAVGEHLYKHQLFAWRRLVQASAFCMATA
jgi:hypothetical protein